VQRRIRFGFPEPITAPQDTSTIANAAQYRQAIVEQRLRQILERRKADAITIDENGRAGFAKQDYLLHEFLKIRVHESTIGIDPNDAEFAVIDGIQLIEYLNSEANLWTRTKKEEHDWLLMERIIRDHVSSNGCGRSTAEIKNICEDEYQNYRENPLDSPTLYELIRELRQEYAGSVEEPPITTED
jgi:hypothetical protein